MEKANAAMNKRITDAHCRALGMPPAESFFTKYGAASRRPALHLGPGDDVLRVRRFTQGKRDGITD